MNRRSFFNGLTILGLLFAVFLGFSYVKTLKTQGDVIENKIEVPQDFANQFTRVLSKRRYESIEKATFLDPEGNRITWEDFDGQFLLVNFWATWCPPCVLELPSLGKLQQKFEDRGLGVIAISMDDARPHNDIKKFLNNRGIGEFAAYFDDVNEVQKAIYMRGLPTSYLLDPKGHILYIFEGDAHWNSPQAIQFFENLITANLK